MLIINGWSVVYEKAIRDDGSLFFASRLTRQFLDEKRKEQGSFIFANQYQNECIPDDARSFSADWIRYYDTLPPIHNTFVFIDPAISQEADADYTAVVVVHVDFDNNWFVSVANRYKTTPTELINKIGEVFRTFKPNVIGIEDVAYQKALLYLIFDHMKATGEVWPVKGIKPDNRESKESRILGLVPRFEWGKIFLAKGLTDLEDEMLTFPRGKHDDLIDSLAYIAQISYVPTREVKDEEQLHPSHPGYEAQYIRRLQQSSGFNGD
jgi:predicted phage terminase large subunit-like protein